MNRPTLIASIGHAIICSLLMSVWISSLTFLGFTSSHSALILFPVVCCYTYLLFCNIKNKTGLITLLGFHVLIGLTPMIFPFLDQVCCLAMLLTVWLTRVRLHHKHLVPTMMDAALVLIGLMWSGWTTWQSHSLYLGFWTFMLSQSLWVLIPERVYHKTQNLKKQKFDQAFQKAEQALMKLNA